MIGTTLAHYKIVKKLGAGGMGEVYLAEDTKLGRQVALKTLPPRFATSQERVERFRREAAVLAALDHPGIVTIYSIEEVEDVRFLTMQHVEGKSLSAVIPKHGLPLEEFLRVAVPLADALSAAHEKNIVHRDLKPSNIMLTPEGRVKILDFGLAKLLRPEGKVGAHDETTDTLTGDFRVPGTLPYMSPEQIRGLAADHRSDIFSLGIVLYQMATGEYPFRRVSSPELASSILNDTPSSVSDIRSDLPGQLDWILKLCLQKDPDKRMQSVKDLRNELEYLEQEISAVSAEPAELAQIRKRSRVLVGLLTGVAAIALVLGVLLILRSSQPAPPETGPPHFLAVEPVRSFTGSSDRYFPAGVASFLAGRAQGLDGLYILVTDSESHVPDFRLEIDTRREGQAVNLSYRLVDARSQSSLGGRILNGSQETIVALADEIGAEVAELLRTAGVSSADYRALSMPTRDGAAFENFLRGLEHFSATGSATDLGLAQRAFAAAWSVDPDFGLARAYDGIALQRQYGEAHDPQLLVRSEALCAEASRAEPKLALAHFCLAEGHRLGRKPLEAVREYRRAIELGLRTALAYGGARASFIELGRPRSEEDFWSEMIAIDPRFWLGFSYRADFHLEQGELQAALEDAQRAAELAPGNTGVYLTLWYVQTEMGRLGEALQTLERGLEVDPDDYRLWGNLGYLYFQLRRFDEAIEAHTRTVELAPEDCRAYGFLGRDYYWAPGRREEARPHLERAIELCEQQLQAEPTSSGTELLLAWYRAMLGEEQHSRRTLAAVLEDRPNDAHFLYVAGLIATVLGDVPQALDYFERAAAGGWSIAELRTTVEVDSLRAEPRFQELFKRGE
jgi:serine/threonine protein kinase/tetratricopeptide (TPR) repeat protein